jgi:hypothetical protein
MTDAIDAEVEALARARCESGRPMLSDHFDDPPDPTMRRTVADRPVVELVLALVDDDGRVDGNPTRTRVAMCYEDGDFAEDVLDGATTLREALTRLLGQLNGQPN